VNILYSLDLIGTFVFAVSGTLSAANKKLDLFGAIVIGFVTAVGGGTVRDLLLDIHPIGWMKDTIYVSIILAGAIFAFLFKQWIITLRRTMFLFDTIGIGVFTVLGVQKALNAGVHPVYAVLMGMVSSVVGGVLRDTLNNDIPLIFRKEIYATVCLAGGALYLLLDTFETPQYLNEVVTVMTIITARILVIRYKLNMPTLSINESSN
jgi:uncharacterized membrane protein YeiH